MSLVGYARVSSTDQSLDIQREQLRDAGCERVFEEQRSGTTTDGREALKQCLEWVRNGDVLVVTRLDRLARSTMDMLETLKTLEKRGCAFRCLLQPIDTTTPHGRMFITMLAAFAEFETAVRAERQMEGINRAKAQGKFRGGQRRISESRMRELRAQGMGATEIAKTLGCHRKSVYRLLPDGGWDNDKPFIGNAATQPHPPPDTRSEPTVKRHQPWFKSLLGA